MKSLRSISITLSLAVVALCSTAPQSASAAVIPGGFNPTQIHGKFAWGDIGSSRPGANSRQFARVNLHTGATIRFSPSVDSAQIWLGPSTDRAAVAIALDYGHSENQTLVRHDIFAGTQILDSLAQSGNCWGSLVPISIAEDGTVIALKRIPFDGPLNGPCSLDPSKTRLLRYSPGQSGGQEVWLPAKYRTWLTNYNLYLDANGNSLALGKPAIHNQPGRVVVLDTAKHKVLAQHAAGRISSIALANPHSLYWAQDGSRQYGKVNYWRIGNPAPRRIFRGEFNSSFMRNCGNRFLVIRGLTMKLLSPTGKTLLRRRVRTDHFIGGVACSGSYLHFLDFQSTDDYYGNDPFVRHIANISKLR